MTDAVAALIQSSINAASPEDPKVLKAITGALKDLRELMEKREDGGESEVIIRVEGGAPRAPESLGREKNAECGG